MVGLISVISYRYRQYGLWERYAELYSKEDLAYNVGTSDYKKDWYFAQNTRLAVCTTHKISLYRYVLNITI